MSSGQEPPETEQEVPFYPFAALGYRSWHLKGGELHPLHRKAGPWRRGENLATCIYGHHPAPGPSGSGCHCGFNAYYSFREARHQQLSATVLGAIAGYGQLELHDEGFRAEKARLIALLRPSILSWTRRKDLKRLAKDLGVPLLPRRRLRRLAGGSIGAPVPPDQDRERCLRARHLAGWLQMVNAVLLLLMMPCFLGLFVFGLLDWIALDLGRITGTLALLFFGLLGAFVLCSASIVTAELLAEHHEERRKRSGD